MKQYTHLSLLEREQLFIWYEALIFIWEVGRRLNRSPGTISRELKRNASGSGRNSRERYLQSKHMSAYIEYRPTSESMARKNPIKSPLRQRDGDGNWVKLGDGKKCLLPEGTIVRLGFDLGGGIFSEAAEVIQVFSRVTQIGTFGDPGYVLVKEGESHLLFSDVVLRMEPSNNNTYSFSGHTHVHSH